MRLPPTCQAAVHQVVLLPKPENCLVGGFHRVHGLFSHLFKVLPAFLTAKEGADVTPDGLQHCLGVAFETCRGKAPPERVRLSTELGAAAPATGWAERPTQDKRQAYASADTGGKRHRPRPGGAAPTSHPEVSPPCVWLQGTHQHQEHEPQYQDATTPRALRGTGCIFSSGVSCRSPSLFPVPFLLPPKAGARAMGATRPEFVVVLL